MKITQVNCDHKEDIEDEIDSFLAKAENFMYTHDYEYTQDHVDSNVAFLSDTPLTEEQLDKLWQVGDLHTGDHHWEGDSFDDILGQIKAYVETYEEE